MGDETDYSLILQFDDQSPSFALGVQIGMIWERTKTRERFLDQISGDNLELVQRMASRCNYRFDLSGGEHGWYTLEATPKEDV